MIICSVTTKTTEPSLFASQCVDMDMDVFGKTSGFIRAFSCEFKQRLIDCYSQEWNSDGFLLLFFVLFLNVADAVLDKTLQVSVSLGSFLERRF